MFVSVKSLEYRSALDVEAFPVSDSIVVGGELVPFYSANHQFMEYLKFNDYRLLWKFGIMYRKKNLSFGLAMTTPSVGVYSDGKKTTRKLKEDNITDPETGTPLPDFVVVDFQEKKSVDVNFKDPFSIAAGLTYNFPEKSRTLYTTVEYFNGLDPYRMVKAEENPTLAAGTVYENIDFNEWLTFISGAKPVLNIAIGYRSQLKEHLMLMTGFRTDFNYRKGLNYHPFIEAREIKGLDIDIYHLSGGLALTILGQDLITGLQYSFGRRANQKQLVNLSDPLEYNESENAALQGNRQNNMSTLFNSLSLYFGATFNFGGEKK